VKVETNTNYTVSHRNTIDDGSYGIYVYTPQGGDIMVSDRKSPVTFNSGNNKEMIVGMYKSGALSGLTEAVFVQPQMEVGVNQTEFESYNGTVKRAQKGLRFDGRQMVLSSTPISVGTKTDITVIFKTNSLWKTMALIDQYSYGFAILLNANGGIGVRLGADTATTNYLSRETAFGVAYLDDKIHKVRLVVEPYYYWVYVDDVLLLEGAPQSAGKTYSGLNMNAKYSIGARTNASGGIVDLAYNGDILYTCISDGEKILSEFDFTKPDTIVGAMAYGTGMNGTVIGKPQQLNKQARR
jgi:hypothetical protein